jgi:hypothetical protein
MFMHVNAKYMTHDGDLMNNLYGKKSFLLPPAPLFAVSFV